MQKITRFYDARELRVGDKVRVLKSDHCDFYGNDVMISPDEVDDAYKLQENGAVFVVTEIAERHEGRTMFIAKNGEQVVETEEYTTQCVLAEDLVGGFELMAHPTFLAPVPGETYIGDCVLVSYMLPVVVDGNSIAESVNKIATETEERLRETIRSACQMLTFGPHYAPNTVISLLEKEVRAITDEQFDAAKQAQAERLGADLEGDNRE